MLNFKNKKVAIVGSSGNLLERNYADLIDSHDYVLRFNQARVIGYEKYVGSKTTHRIVNVHTFLGTTGNDRFPKNDPHFIPKLKDQEIIINSAVPQSAINKRSPSNKVSIISSDFFKYCESLLEYKKQPSVGFLGVILALESTSDIDIFGFDQENTTSKKHYWEEVKALGQWHDFDIEKQYFADLSKNNKIKIFK